MQHESPDDKRLFPSDVIGVSFTVGELIAKLSRLDAELPIVSGRNNEKGIALHHHAFVNPAMDYVSFKHLNSL
jgi:hypothetical protein